MNDIETEPQGYSERRSPNRAWVLGLLGTIATFAFFFFRLASEVRENDSRAIDRAILVALRIPGHLETPRGPAWLRESITDLSSLGSPTVLWLVVLLVCTYLVSRRSAYLAVVVLSVIGSGCFAVSLFKTWFDRARPEVVPHLVPAYTLSFPSGHAADSAIVYLTLAMLITRFEKRRQTRILLVASAIALTMMAYHWKSSPRSTAPIAAMINVNSGVVVPSTRDPGL